jgi:hypothetical protein
MSGAPGNNADHIPRSRKIADMIGVRAYGNEPEVELWLNENGRLVVVAYNEAGYCGTKVDLYDILDWVQAGPGHGVVLDHGPMSARVEFDPSRN